MTKKSILIMVVALLLIAAVGCQKQESKSLNSLEKVQQAGKLMIGLDDSFPPMEFRDAENNLVGFDIDLGHAIAGKLGVKAEFLPTDFNGIILALTSGKFDAIIATLSITEERKKTIAFSEPYIMEGIIVAVKNGNEAVKTMSDLKDKVIACQLGSTSEAAASKIEGYKELKKYDKVTEAFQDLAIGRVDAVVVDEIVGRYYMSQKQGEYTVLEGKLNDEPVGVGFKQEDTELREAIQKSIDELKADGTLSQISIKWFGVDLYN